MISRGYSEKPAIDGDERGLFFCGELEKHVVGPAAHETGCCVAGKGGCAFVHSVRVGRKSTCGWNGRNKRNPLPSLATGSALSACAAVT